MPSPILEGSMDFITEYNKLKPLMKEYSSLWGFKYRQPKEEIFVLGQEILFEIVQERPEELRFFLRQWKQTVVRQFKQYIKTILSEDIEGYILPKNINNTMLRATILYTRYPQYKEILDLLGEGFAIDDIASKLSISRRKIYYIIKEIKSKET